MKTGLAAWVGQSCHCMSCAEIDWPSWMSVLATRISTVSI